MKKYLFSLDSLVVWCLPTKINLVDFCEYYVWARHTFSFAWNDTKETLGFDSLNSWDNKYRSSLIFSAKQNLIKPMVFRSFFLCAVQYMSFRQSLFRAKLKVKLYSPRVPIFLCAQRSFINSFECRFESLGLYWVEQFSEREFIFWSFHFFRETLKNHCAY